MTETLIQLSTPGLRSEAHEISMHVETHPAETLAMAKRILKTSGLTLSQVAAAIDFDLASNAFMALKKQGGTANLGSIEELVAAGEKPHTLAMLKVACLVPKVIEPTPDIRVIAAINQAVNAVLKTAPPTTDGSPALAPLPRVA